jgi:dihydropyrimidinase
MLSVVNDRARWLIRGGTLVDGSGTRQGDVLVEGEVIAAIGENVEATGARVIEAGGALVIPGGIDVHTHFDLPVGAVRSADDFESGTIAAACGGTTCVVDFAGAGREPPQEALRLWHDRALGRAAVDYGFHLTVTSVPEDPEEAIRTFAWCFEQGVTSVKLYMAYPDRLMVDDDTLARAFAAGASTGVRVSVHAEDGAEVERRTANALAAGERHPRTISQVRPPAVEAEAVRRAADLAHRAGGSVYVVHLSSRAGLDALLAARAAGRSVVVETCPQYLTLTSVHLEGPQDEAAAFVCAPPLRADGDRHALWAGLADGTVQVVATDHCPFTSEDRAHGTVAGQDHWTSFAEIPGGLPGVETRVALVYQGVRQGVLSLDRWVDSIAGAPARLFGLSPAKGSLAPGSDADVVVFDPEAHRLLDAARLHMRTDQSPYQGMEVAGWPTAVFSRGRLVSKDGEPADIEAGRGRFVRRRRIPPGP